MASPIFSILDLMAKLALLALVLMLAACGGAATTKCPDPDSDPNSPCATSHGQTPSGNAM
jgi:hypothetical protein